MKPISYLETEKGNPNNSSNSFTKNNKPTPSSIRKNIDFVSIETSSLRDDSVFLEKRFREANTQPLYCDVCDEIIPKNKLYVVIESLENRCFHKKCFQEKFKEK